MYLASVIGETFAAPPIADSPYADSIVRSTV